MEFQLLDGTAVEGFAKEQASETVNNAMAIDTTGQYLTFGKPEKTAAVAEEAKISTEANADLRLLASNLALLLSNARRVLTDSRMFLAPMRINNNLAYTGTSGFRGATLGVYLQWYLTSPASRFLEEPQSEATSQSDDDDKDMRFVCQVAGSPLSGANHCTVCDLNGNITLRSLSPFRPVWESFTDINRRYDEPKARCQAYTLEQTLDILRSEGATVHPRRLRQIFEGKDSRI